MVNERRERSNINGPTHRDSARDEVPARIDDQRIRERAYERYRERGSADGQDLDDWLEAERELRE
jgi:hypothetical protein